MGGRKLVPILIGLFVLTGLILLIPQNALAGAKYIYYRLYPGNNATIDERRPQITFIVDRTESTISSISIYLDDKSVLSEYDGLKTRTFIYVPESDLTIGKHKISIRVDCYRGYTNIETCFTVAENTTPSPSPSPSPPPIVEPKIPTPAPTVLPNPVIYDQNAIKVYVNGRQLQFDVQPSIIDGRTMVPLRFIAEALGLNVEFDSGTKTVIASQANNTVKLVVDGKAFKNGTEFPLDVPAMVSNGRTLVPVRFLSEAFEASVSWDAASKTVIITKNPQDTNNEFKIATMCRDVNLNTFVPINSTTEFNLDDNKVFSFIELEKPLEGYALEGKWYFINGSSRDLVFSDSNCTQHDRTFWFWLDKNKLKSGKWEFEAKIGNKTKTLAFDVLVN